MTEHLTHKVASERYEYAGKVSNAVLMRFVNATRKPDFLTRLMLPLPTKETTVTVNPVAIADAGGANVIEAEFIP